MIWRPLNNLVKSLKTYHILSPDPKARQEVNQWLSGTALPELPGVVSHPLDAPPP